MKTPFFVLFLIVSNFTFSFTFYQGGTIYLKNSEIKAGEENSYIYKPANGLLLPDNATISAVYEAFNKKNIPLIRKRNYYEFSIKVPDSIDVLIMAITDKENNVIDNNYEKGYVIYLKNKTREELEKSKLSYLQLSDLANYFLSLKISPPEKIAQFEELFKENPKLKENSTIYFYYLFVKFQNNQEKTTPEIMAYAKILETKNEEKSLIQAFDLYSWLGMDNKYEQLKKIILSKYPKGEWAKIKFINEFYETNNKTEKYILGALQEFFTKFDDDSGKTEKYILGALHESSTKFDDDSGKTKNIFYAELIPIYLKNKDLSNLNKYENLITDKIKITKLYNDYAWKLVGHDITSPGNDLDFAEQLTSKTLDIVKNTMLDPKKNEDLNQFSRWYNWVTETYALILYKQKKYDLAFKYQKEIALQNELDTGGKERYACFAEKAKGPKFAKNYVEKQLLEGIDSKALNYQLQELYKKLNLPENEFEKVKTNYLKLASRNENDNILKKYGSTKEIDFTLTNLQGEKVKLSDYKGKVVVLNFWSTWCGTCRASLPKLQRLANNFEDDNVVFFFINTLERTEPDKNLKNVTKFMKDNGYSFNVLFDFEDDVTAKYKIAGVSKKIVIDKNGNMVSIDSSNDNLEALIDANLN